MLDYINIKGFQSHYDTKIELSKGVNIFVGDSNAGKSTIVRAIRAILKDNFPPRYISTGLKESVIETQINGHKIIRKRTETENMLEIDGKPFGRVGKAGIFKDSGIYPILDRKVGDKYYSFWLMEQGKGGFMSGLSSTEQEALLLSILGVGEIPPLLKNISKDVETNSIKLEFINTNIKEITDEYSNELVKLEEQENKLSVLKPILEIIKNTYKELKDLSEFLEKIDSAKDNLSILNYKITPIKEKLGNIDKLNISLFKTLVKVLELDKNIILLKQTINKKESSINEGLELVKNSSQFKTLSGLFEELTNIETKIKFYGHRINSVKEQLEIKQKELTEIRDQFKNTTCPLCGK